MHSFNHGNRLKVVHGIVLKHTNYSESDKIVTIYTKELGKLRAIAKGIRKINSKRAPHLQVFREAIMTLRENSSGFYSITEALAISPIDVENFSALTASYLMIELVDRLVPEYETNANVYVLLIATLHSLLGLSEKAAYDKTYHSGVLLLQILGYVASENEVSYNEFIPFVERIIQKRIQSKKLFY